MGLESYTFLELLKELVDFFRDPSVFPALANTRVAAVVCGPLVFSVPAAELHGEAWVNSLEVVAEVACGAVEFFRFFAAGVCKLAIAVRSLAVVLEDCREGGLQVVAVLAGAVVLAVDGHPGDGLASVLGQIDYFCDRGETATARSLCCMSHAREFVYMAPKLKPVANTRLVSMQ